MSEEFKESIRNGMTIRILADAGIRKGSKSDADYERSKRIFQKQKLTPVEYERRIRIAAGYIGI